MLRVAAMEPQSLRHPPPTPWGSMAEGTVYHERLSSTRTEVLFVVLAAASLGLGCLRSLVGGVGYMAGALFAASAFFGFYALNYRTLIIRINPGTGTLDLQFGVFSWRVPLHTVARGYVDDTPMWRVGGAGIHFTFIRRRYRVLFNFLEYPRVVLELTEPRGFVRDVAFSTRRPREVLEAVASATGQ